LSYDTSTYQKDFDVIVADAGGNPVAGATVTAKAMSVAYLKGHWTVVADTLVQIRTLTSSNAATSTGSYADPVITVNFCLNEDMYYWGDPAHTDFLSNGILDTGEDYNGSGFLECGTVATVSSSSSTYSTTTDSNGVGTLSVRYLKKFGSWVFVRLNVTVAVGGTEGSAHTTFLLPLMKDDYSTTNPPEDSPFGAFGADCTDLN
jgi:hypothetical protein